MKPDYWDGAKRSLARRDPLMGAIMRARPRVHLARRGEPFMTLARAIVGQQISVKAAQSVWNRVVACVPEVTPAGVLSRAPRALRACGLSDRKTEYIVDLARRFDQGLVHPQLWPDMTDEDVVADLVQVRGIGRWTAEMFLIFNLLRPDVFPVDDLGLQKAISLTYRGGRKVNMKAIRRIGENWVPWRSVATWYLWRSLDPLPVEY
jgi:DNA-3-methyladenine glycosylase II